MGEVETVLDERRLLTLQQVAEVLGLTYEGARGLVRQRRLPARMLNRRHVRVQLSDLEAFIDGLPKR